MTKYTIEDLMEERIVAIIRKKKKKIFPLRDIVKEVSFIDEPDYTWLVDKDGREACFKREFVTILKHTFKNAEWHLSQPIELNDKHGHGGKISCILVGILPRGHYVLLSARLAKRDEGMTQ